MFNIDQSQRRWVLLGLICLMAATRFHHFGSLATLPDASLAVFFLAGLYLAHARVLALLLIEAALIDFLAVEVGGVSDWCVTPGYALLFPGYGVMWLSGLLCRRFNRLTASAAMLIGGMLTGAASLAFLLSNAGFFGFSGYFPEMSWSEYAGRVAKYYPAYLSSTLIYAGLVCAGAYAVALRTAGTVPKNA